MKRLITCLMLLAAFAIGEWWVRRWERKIAKRWEIEHPGKRNPFLRK